MVNFMTKEVATISGVTFTTLLFLVFWASDHAHRRQMGKDSEHHEHLEHFNQSESEEVSPAAIGITKPYRKLVAIRSPHNLAMLDRCLAETDPATTDVVVMTANVLPPASADKRPTITDEDRALLTAVVNMAEHAGKPVLPLIVPTNEPFYALARTAKSIGAQELIMGASNRFDPDVVLDHVALYWMNVCHGHPEPLTIRVLGKDRDIKHDIAGGSTIPRYRPEEASPLQTLADLRESWRGVKRLLLAYDGSPLSADFLDTVMSFLDPSVAVTLMDVAEDAPAGAGDGVPDSAREVIDVGITRARELGRVVDARIAVGDPGPAIVKAAMEGNFDAIFMSLRGEYRKRDTTLMAPTTSYVLQHAPCRVILGFPPKSIRPAGEPAVARAEGASA
jgi:nucleotide-binding universal stress UspA family protein